MTIPRTLLAALLLAPLPLMAQLGANDPTFNSDDAGYGMGDGFDFAVNDILLQPDGMILISGRFSNYNNVGTNCIARLTPNGLLDPSFTPSPVGINSGTPRIRAMGLQPDGHIVVVGEFHTWSGQTRNNVARLLPGGAMDTGFDPGGGANGPVYAVAVQADGKVLIGGEFTEVDGVPRHRMARLHPDGSLDNGFQADFMGGRVEAIAVRSDGKIVIGGTFEQFDPFSVNHIALLTTNGSLDEGFHFNCSGADNTVNDLLIQPDGKIVVVGAFTSFNGGNAGRIVRLMPNGNMDPAFDPGNGADMPIRSVSLSNDGKLMIAGNFNSYKNVPRSRVARILENGDPDANFVHPVAITLTGIDVVHELPDERVLIGGSFQYFGNLAARYLVMLEGTGEWDPTFNQAGGANGPVRTTAIQPDGKILVGGSFTGYAGKYRRGLARLFPDGELDESFEQTGSTEPFGALGGSIHTIALQPDGKVLVGSWQSNTTQSILNRRLPNGSLDPTFQQGYSWNADVQSIVLMPDGRILIGGGFTTYNGVPRNRIARLNPDGSLDTTFDPGTGANNSVEAMAVQADGKVIIGGLFTQVNGVPRSRIARLNNDGSLDEDFDIGTGFNAAVWAMAIQPDGKIIAGGGFATYNGVPRSRIVRIDPDGGLDATFDPGAGFTGASSVVYDIAIQEDGRVIVVGSMLQYDGIPRARIARLGTDGTLDPVFAATNGSSEFILSVSLLPDGNMIIGGSFRYFDGTGRNRVARVIGDAVQPQVVLAPKLFLGGAYDSTTGLMGDELRAQQLLPGQEPYTDIGYVHYLGGQGDAVDPEVFNTTGPAAIVDWVIVELCWATDPSVRIASSNALLCRNGEVVGLDGTSPVGFMVPPGEYHVAVRHRNHLSVITADPLALGYTPATVVDFTLPGIEVWGLDARLDVDGTMVLWPGDANANGEVKYTGVNNDRDHILLGVGGSEPTNTAQGYHTADVNMDGVVKYVGADNDRDVVLQTIGGVVPTNVRSAQIP